ncbi:retrovirus-related pol polyprotein from transposon TNT 1-94 [Tanacetum coccineum]
MVEVPFDGINAAIDGRGNAALWHQRLGYMSEKGMKILASKGRILDLQKVVVGFCEPCVLGKQKKVSFIKFGNTRKLQRLELVHTDVYGPTSVASIGGSRYYVTFINDSSRKSIVAESSLSIVPRTGLGQQNGVAKRINRTLNEREKSMRLHAGLPKMFWEDSVTTATYLINRGPSVPLGFRIPKEELQGKEVSLAHLRVFGCDSYIKVKDVTRDKLDAKSVKCTFIGFGSDEMGYCFWDSKSHKKSLRAQVGAQIPVRDPTTMRASRIVEDQMKKTLKIKHPLRREAPRLHSYKDPLKSPGLRLIAGKKALQSKWVFKVKEEQDGKKSCEDDYNQSAGKEENLVCKLKKSLYGLKQAPRQWYLKFDSFMQRAGYKRCAMDHCSDMAEIKKLQSQLSQEFKMKDLGLAKQIIGMRIIRDKTKGTLRLSQEKYIGNVLEKFNMKDAEARCQPLKDHFKLSKKQAPKTEASKRRMTKVPYASAVGSVMYAMVVLKGFSDSEYGGCLDSGKSTTGYVFTVGGTPVSWMSRIQKCVAMSTTKAEYMAIVEADKELVWLKNFLEELDRAQTECVMFCDNQSAIHLAKNLMFHGRTKHIKIRYHYIRELVSKGTLSLKKILGAKNPADMLTKVVTTEKLKLCAASTGLRDN